jgi:HSP20 family molecular chaperone IbpA
MWAEACAFIEQAERMHRQFFRLTASERTRVLWAPPVDVLEDDHEIVVVVALPGVPAARVDVTTEPGAIVVRGERPLPFVGSRFAIRQLEIPYGTFERRIPLPEVRLEAGQRELKDGCLVLRLRKTG